MARWVALLRGINVGGNKKVSMAELRTMLGEIGFEDVATVLQSGNAVFTAKKGKEADIIRKVESELDARLGMNIRCLARSAAEMRAILDANPLADEATNNSRYLVTFLSDKLPAGALDQDTLERSVVIGREVYSWLPDGINDAKVAKINWDKRFGVVASGRNWNTVVKLTELVQA
ncbi:MAG TPA: DUF1697 domain-containing protein [Micromonosporaceae bacterium]